MERVRIGVVGCGAIAQIQHMPFLTELAEEFEVTAVCDVSPLATDYVANLYHVPSRFTDYRYLLDSDIDAVLLCQTDPKTEIAVAAFDAGKHVFIEKPICFSLKEANAITDAAQKSGKVGQAGYVKLYEPAYQFAKTEVATMEGVRFVQVNHLHPSNDLHIRQFRTRSFNDVPGDVASRNKLARQSAINQAVGEVSLPVLRAFGTVSGSLIHDLYTLRDLFGVPKRIVSTEIWKNGSAISTTLEYPRNLRCVATWIDLPELWDFHETLGVYGKNKRVIVSYETGFSRGVSRVSIQEVDNNGTTVTREPAMDWESPFRKELRHFHDCIINNKTPDSPIFEIRKEIGVVIDIIKAYQET